MKPSKTTIKKRIFFSHIIIILISLILTAAVFDACLRIFIRTQTKKQLIAAGDIVKKSMSEDLQDLNIIIQGENNKELIKGMLEINRTLRKTQSFLDINYAILGKNKNIIYPLKESSQEYLLLQNNLLPVINKRKLITSETKKNNVFYFYASGKRYAATIYPLESSNNLKKGYLLIYSDLDKSSKLTTIVNIMLLSIMFIAAIIALIISNNVSEKISRPISQLSKYANKIGERKYDMEPIKYNDDEIGQLAETMYSMTQKLSAYDSTMKTFMQNASHELRTPLMSIQGYAEGIKYGVVDDQNKAIDIVIEESKRLSQLVEDLLYLSKIDALQEEMNFERINTEDIIRSSIERVSGIAVKNEKVINFSSNENNIMLQGDEEKLIRAIINILGNSLRYSKKYIDVTLKKEGSKIIILLEDDGPGFDEKDITNIFDRFYKGKQGNYGLGLAITKSIIEKHNGSIVAENRIKGGACFKITLPSESD